MDRDVAQKIVTELNSMKTSLQSIAIGSATETVVASMRDTETRNILDEPEEEPEPVTNDKK